MKKALFVGMAAGLLALGIQSKAEAALATFIHICQGGTCLDFGPGSGSLASGAQTIGDYTIVDANVAGAQAPGISQTQVTNIQVQRTGSGSANPLDVWVAVTGYTQPTGPVFLMSSTATATRSLTNATDLVSYTAWYDAANGHTFPGGVLGNTGSCTPAGGTTSPTSCTGNSGPTAVGAGSALYSLIARTTFNISVGDASIFGSNAQTTITAVPEPMSVMLLGTGLLGLAAGIRRRIKK